MTLTGKPNSGSYFPTCNAPRELRSTSLPLNATACVAFRKMMRRGLSNLRGTLLSDFLEINGFQPSSPHSGQIPVQLPSNSFS
jgi:hypothetical protein